MHKKQKKFFLTLQKIAEIPNLVGSFWPQVGYL